LIRGRINRGRQRAAPQFWRALFAAGCMGTMVTTACHRSVDSAPGISVKGVVTPQPVRVGLATISVELADPSQNPVPHATIMVEADMTHPGMSPVFAEAKETAPGNYHAPIDFNMGGDWVVLLHIKLADGRKVERQMDVKGVQSN
jgi:hypothetical protein